MPRLFLIRHGEPEAAWGGDADDPGLSDAGREQARRAAHTLAEIGRLSPISSPMRRCRETAAPFLQLAGAEALIERRVSEVPTPPGTADRRAWLQTNFPWRGGAPRSWRTLDDALHGWRRELLNCLRELDQDTAIFSHFIAINVIVGAALEREETIVCKPDYASITEIEATPSGLRLVRLGAEMLTGDVR